MNLSMSNSLYKYRFPLLWIFILAITCAVMLPGLSGGFFFDDTPNIVENKSIHITSLDAASLKQSFSGPQAGPLGRPVSVLSFAITHYFFGLDPVAFKTINLFLHAFNGLLVAWLVLILLRSAHTPNFLPESKSLLSVWIAGIWLVHPINVVPVMLSVQRMTLLASMFLLLALISHVKATSIPKENRSHWLWLAAGWLIFWPLAILSKETGLLFPLFILAITFLLKPGKNYPQVKKSWVIAVSVIAMLLIIGLMITYLGWNWLDGAYKYRPFTLSERLMTESRVLAFYASQILLPNLSAFGIYLDDIALSTSLLSPPTTVLSIGLWTTVISGILYLRKTDPFLALSMAWFLVGHSLESTFLPLEIAHEYRNYMPSIGLIAGIGYLGLNVFYRLKSNQRSFVIKLLPILPFIVLALLTWSRTELLSNPILGVQIEAARHPHSARALHTAALTLFKAGYGDQHDPQNGEKIRDYLQRSVVTDRTFKLGYLSLIVWACASERPVDPSWLDGFAVRLAQTPYGPKDQELPYHILNFLVKMPGCLPRHEALRLLEAGASNSRISGITRSGFFSAIADYELAISKDPRSAHVYMTRAVAASPFDQSLRGKLEILSVLTTQ